MNAFHTIFMFQTHGRTDKTNLARNWTMLKRKRQNDTTSLILLILLTFLPLLTLASKLEKTHSYDLQLEGLFPERADLHLEFSNKHELVNLEDSIRRDRAFFEIPEGVSRAYLHVEESYSSTIVVASLDPFFDSDHGKTVRRSLYHRTVKVRWVCYRFFFSILASEVLTLILTFVIF